MKSLRVKYLEYEQVEAILSFLDRCDDERLYIAIALMFWGALRLSEVHQLRPCDIDLERGTLRLRYTKGDKPREGVIPHSLCDRLRWYVKHNRDDVDRWSSDFDAAIADNNERLERAARKRENPAAWVHRQHMLYMQSLRSPLFGVRYQAIQKAVMRLPARVPRDDPSAALLRDVVMSPHTLRHSFGRYWLKNKGDLSRLSKQLGHSSIAITNDVYGHMDMSALEDEYRRISGESSKSSSD